MKSTCQIDSVTPVIGFQSCFSSRSFFVSDHPFDLLSFHLTPILLSTWDSFLVKLFERHLLQQFWKDPLGHRTSLCCYVIPLLVWSCSRLHKCHSVVLSADQINVYKETKIRTSVLVLHNIYTKGWASFVRVFKRLKNLSSLTLKEIKLSGFFKDCISLSSYNG